MSLTSEEWKNALGEIASRAIEEAKNPSILKDALPKMLSYINIHKSIFGALREGKTLVQAIFNFATQAKPE